MLACNTATVAAVADLRQRYPDWPMVGMEPAVKPAAAATRSGVVGVLATTGTLQSAKFAALLDRFANLQGHHPAVPRPGGIDRNRRFEWRGLAHDAARLCRAAAGRRLRHHYSGLHALPLPQAFAQPMLPPSIVLIDTGAAVARPELQRHGTSAACEERPARGNTAMDYTRPRISKQLILHVVE